MLKDVKASASIVVINALVNDPRLSQVANVPKRPPRCMLVHRVFFFQCSLPLSIGSIRSARKELHHKALPRRPMRSSLLR